MGFEFHKTLIETVEWEAVYWEGVRASEKLVLEYEKRNPFPKVKSPYTLEDFVKDISGACGPITLPNNTPKEVVRWVETAIFKFLIQ